MFSKSKKQSAILNFLYIICVSLVLSLGTNYSLFFLNSSHQLFREQITSIRAMSRKEIALLSFVFEAIIYQETLRETRFKDLGRELLFPLNSETLKS